MPSRAPDFRYIFANNFQIQATANELTVKLGYTEDARKPLDSIYEEFGLVLTLAGAKTLGRLLSTTIANFERDAGVTIPVDLEELDQLVRSGLHTVTKDGVTKKR